MKYALFISSILFCLFTHAQTYSVESLKLNTSADEFAAVNTSDGIIFVSNRRTETFASFMDAEGQQTTSWFKQDENGSTQWAPELQGVFNEGPLSLSVTGDSLLFTANLNTKLNASRRSRMSGSGIFMSTKVNGDWSDPIPFPHNMEGCQTGHPTWSRDGKFVIFASDRPGGSGGADLWLSRWDGAIWATPEQLKGDINSGSSELYPFIDERGWLFFSSDREGGLGGFDVYQCALQKDGTFSEPVRLDEPINSPNHDYAYSTSEKGEAGMITSDRNGNNDNIFSVNYEYPIFEYCSPSKKPSFCYYIEETKIVETDTLPIVYEWDFGDGTTGRGLFQKHCFPDYGTYDVYLNIYDTIAETSFAKVSETRVVIEPPYFPLIDAPDTVRIGEHIQLKSIHDHMEDFPMEGLYWQQPDGTRIRGDEMSLEAIEEGTMEIQLGALSVKQEQGYLKACSVKEIVVVGAEENIAEANKERTDYAPLQLRGLGQIGNVEIEKEIVVYFVEITSSEEQIPLSDPFFEHVDYPITERYEDQDSSYHYSVGEVTEITALYKIYKELVNKGYEQAVVLDRSERDFDSDFVKRGMYFPEEVKNEMNAEMNKLSDIQFASNSHRISAESYTNLNTVVEVMLLNPEIELMIHAHTDAQGSEKYNQELSEKRGDSVLKYLVRKGIDASRLDYIGHGNSNPVASNDTEEGRARNRRVQFEILFEIMEDK